MPIYDYECAECGSVFEVIISAGDNPPLCPKCRSSKNRRLPGLPAVHIREADQATARIEKRVKDYLKGGDLSGATRFADQAASMVKSDKVKRLADKLHQKADK